MVEKESLFSYKKALEKRRLSPPKIHVVLGSGFGQAINSLSDLGWRILDEILWTEIYGLPGATVVDHRGSYLLTQSPSGQVVQWQLGRLHGYEGHPPRVVISLVMLPRLCGANTFFLTNAAGGLLPEHKPGAVMIIKDHVNFTGKNPLIGPNPTHPETTESLGPRFPDCSQIYDPNLQVTLKYQLAKQGLQVTEGVYLGLLGPSFETPAEIRIFKQWGIGAVGMSTVWESLALHHSGARVVGLSMISNLAAGISSEPLSHEEVIETAKRVTRQILDAIAATIEEHK